MTTTAAVRDALRGIVDPCSAATGSNLDIVEMGLVESIDVSDGHARVGMRLTTPACHMGPYFIKETKERVGALHDVESVSLDTDGGFEWSEDMMTDDAKERRQAVLDEQERRYREEIEAERRSVVRE